MATLTENERGAIASRFITFRNKYIQLGQVDLAKESGLNQKTISFIETGKQVPSTKLLAHLSKKYKLNGDWLMTGKGDPIGDFKPNPSNIANMQARITQLERQFKELQATLNKVLEKLG